DPIEQHSLITRAQMHERGLDHDERDALVQEQANTFAHGVDQRRCDVPLQAGERKLMRGGTISIDDENCSHPFLLGSAGSGPRGSKVNATPRHPVTTRIEEASNIHTRNTPGRNAVERDLFPGAARSSSVTLGRRIFVLVVAVMDEVWWRGVCVLHSV